MDAKALIAIAASPLVLAACGGMPVSSMLKLRGVDFGTTDLSALVAGVELPQELQPLPEGARLIISVQHGDGTRQERSVKLAPSHAIADRDPLRAHAPAGASVAAYRVAPEELPALERFRAEVREQRARSGTASRLMLSVAADSCRAGPLPDGPLPLTTYLKTSETGEFVALARNLDLRALAGDRAITQRIPACPSADGRGA
jgi:hypothetical protein